MRVYFFFSFQFYFEISERVNLNKSYETFVKDKSKKQYKKIKKNFKKKLIKSKVNPIRMSRKIILNEIKFVKRVMF